MLDHLGAIRDAIEMVRAVLGFIRDLRRLRMSKTKEASKDLDERIEAVLDDTLRVLRKWDRYVDKKAEQDGISLGRLPPADPD